MLVNRYILQDNSIKEVDIDTLIRRARTLGGVRHIVKTILTPDNRIIPVAHFDLIELITALEKFKDRTRIKKEKIDREISLLKRIQIDWDT